MDQIISCGLICTGYICVVGLPRRRHKVVPQPSRVRKDKLDYAGDALRRSFPVVGGFND